METLDWRILAACRGADPELFFPVSGLDQVQRAKAVCGGCLVRRDCLLFALATGQQYGVWGGLTETERRFLIVPRQRPGADPGEQRCA
jgi:WhiB family redox-sensing transcriptional regulator